MRRARKSGRKRKLSNKKRKWFINREINRFEETPAIELTTNILPCSSRFKLFFLFIDLETT
jgi:hypothetical protein